MGTQKTKTATNENADSMSHFPRVDWVGKLPQKYIENKNVAFWPWPLTLTFVTLTYDVDLCDFDLDPRDFDLGPPVLIPGWKLDFFHF